MSSWLLMGLPGVAYLSGVADASWTAIGLIIGTYINWLVVAKRIRVYSQVTSNSITLPDFFSRRFRDEKNILMAISATMIIIFFIPYTASGFAACGKLFNTLFGIVSFAWAGFGGTFAPLVIMSLFWKRTNIQGALAGMLVGGSTIFIWKYLVKPMGGIWGTYELLPAFILGVLAIVVVSLLTPPPEQEIMDEFEEVKRQCREK